MSFEKLAYHRLETDKEFQVRIAEAKGIWFVSAGQRLDDDAWRYFSMQRRIVFVPV